MNAAATTEEASEIGAAIDESQLGRYRLHYELGHGGMATVYLASAEGPGGFHKWFAVKRIHPHLAKEQRFVDMFLDEARIAASVQHPNVAQVQDLGVVDGEYFIAMEYLHGEHLGQVAMRCQSLHERMDWWVASHVIAAAARGLHGAHEACDADGEPLGLVHRDVSPQNIFVTFSGQVKLTDFGIAKAAGRLTNTNTGNMKGKAPYMSPEQALASAVDRRSDIFSLGVVLWELTTGKRLFKGESDAQSLMRITSGRVKAPSQVVEGYPEALEAIVMRALAQRPDDRYATAQEMADELEAFLSPSSESMGEAELADLMHELLADRQQKRDEILSGTFARPAALRDREASAVLQAVGRSSGWMWVPVLVVAMLAAGALFLAGGRSPSAEAPTPLREAAPPPPEVAPARGRVRIETQPAGASITLDGRQLADPTPLDLGELEPGRHELKIELDGHEPLTTTIRSVANEQARLSFSLRSLPLPAAMAPEPTPRRGQRRSTMMVAPEPEMGTLTVRAIPWAVVRVDDRPPTSTPIESVPVRSGRVTLRYRFRGRVPEHSRVVSVAPNREASILLRPESTMMSTTENTP